MANRSIELGRLVRQDPEEASRRIVAALRSCRGNIRATSRVLNVSLRTTWRWIERLDLTPKVMKIRKKHGWNLNSVKRFEALPPRANPRDFVRDF